jgi:hypothetical protein
MRALTESPSAFCNRKAFWTNGKEIALFDKTGRILQLRLTRKVIRTLDDDRIARRAPGSDWIHFRVSEDLRFIEKLARMAIRAHAHLPKRRPPRGEDLARRRRFH